MARRRSAPEPEPNTPDPQETPATERSSVERVPDDPGAEPGRDANDRLRHGALPELADLVAYRRAAIARLEAELERVRSSRGSAGMSRTAKTDATMRLERHLKDHLAALEDLLGYGRLPGGQPGNQNARRYPLDDGLYRGASVVLSLDAEDEEPDEADDAEPVEPPGYVLPVDELAPRPLPPGPPPEPSRVAVDVRAWSAERDAERPPVAPRRRTEPTVAADEPAEPDDSPEVPDEPPAPPRAQATEPLPEHLDAPSEESRAVAAAEGWLSRPRELSEADRDYLWMRRQDED